MAHVEDPWIQEQFFAVDMKFENAIQQHELLRSKIDTLENALREHITKPQNIEKEAIITDLETSNEVNTVENDFHCWAYLQRFIDSSTLHGIQRINGAIWTKLFWSLLIVGAIGYASWQLMILLTEYYKYQVFVDVKFHVGHQEFPQITLCHKNPYQRSKIFHHKAFQHLNESSSTLEIKEILYNLTEKERISLGYESTEIGIDFRYKKALEPRLEYTLINGNCYVYHPSKKSFDLLINLRTNDTMFEWNSKPHAYVILNQNGVHPFSKPHNIIHIKEPGTTNSVKLQLEVINRLNGNYGNCQDDEEEFQEKNGLVYTKELCKNVCMIKYAMNKCGCIPANLVYPNKYTFVTDDMRPCLPSMHSALNCAYDLKLENKNRESSCQCKTKCLTTRYAVKAKLTPFREFADSMYDYICKGFNSSCNSNSKQWVKSNIALVTFSFQDQMYKEFTEKPLYPFTRFISDIGGTLGICLGASVLTLFELVQLFVGIFPLLVRRYVTRQM